MNAPRILTVTEVDAAQQRVNVSAYVGTDTMNRALHTICELRRECGELGDKLAHNQLPVDGIAERLRALAKGEP